MAQTWFAGLVLNGKMQVWHVQNHSITGVTPYELVSPFDLLVVPHAAILNEHYTMSTKGVVHVTDGGESAGEFYPLGEWMRCGEDTGTVDDDTEDQGSREHRRSQDPRDTGIPSVSRIPDPSQWESRSTRD